MYNNYPDSFKENCAKKIGCDNSLKTCKNSSIYIKKELNKLKKSNSKKNNSKIQCIEYDNPKKEIQMEMDFKQEQLKQTDLNWDGQDGS